jgi:alkylhydroperoxidase family enzyme
MYGLSDDEIADLLGDRLDKFAAPEQSLLRLADAMSDTPVDVSDALYAELRSHFSEEALIELAADVAQENYRARWNRVFDVGSDALYCPIPARGYASAQSREDRQ